MLPLAPERHEPNQEFADPCNGDCSPRREFLRTAAGSLAVLFGVGTLVPWTDLLAMPGARAGTVRYPIPSADGVSIDSRNEVILCRSQGDVYAFALSCPHQNTALKALPRNAGFQCPRHKSRYQANGTFMNGKATRNMDRLPITRSDNDVIVDVDVALASDTEPAKWAAAFVKV